MSNVPAGFVKIDASKYACQIFALCENSAVGFYSHPVYGPMASCQRCADRLDYTLGDGYVGPDPTRACAYGDATEPEHDHDACTE